MTSAKSVMGVNVGSLLNDRYEIVSLLGTGGFAAVFKAHDSQIERDVAIKVLNVDTLVSQGNDLETVLERFQREAKLAARINHPCVVQIFDFGVLQESENPFIIMELLHGHDLKDEIKEKGPLDPKRMIPLFIDTLEALGDAHKMGIVHKDIKPTNLFLADPGTRRESLKLVDFGIAHIAQTSEENRLTKTGYMLGTPQYMAPEYVESQIVSPALDVYQMALLLVEMLAARGVINETNPWKCALMHVSRELSIPIELLSSPVGPILDKALSLNPEDRYPDAAAFADALANVDLALVPKLNPGAPTQFLSPSSAEVMAPTPNTGELQTAQPPLQERPDPTGAITEEQTAQNLAATAPNSGLNPSFQSPPKKDHKKSVILLLILLVFLSGAAIFFLPNGESEETGTQAPAALIEAPAPIESPPSTQEVEVEPPPEELEEPPVPEPVLVEVRAFPREASIRLDDELLGEGQAELIFDEDREVFEIEIRHEGYITQTLAITADDEPLVTARLQEEPRQAAPAPRPTARPTPAPSPQPRPQPTPTPEPEEDSGGMRLAP